MKTYTFNTKQFGLMGADAAVFCNSVHIWTSPMVQATMTGDTDRKKAARVAREHIFDLKQMDGLRHAS